MISKHEFIGDCHNMWGVLHLTGYIVGGPLWAFCYLLWRGIWDREIALWFLSSWAQSLPSGVIVTEYNMAICYRIQVMCICGKLNSLLTPTMPYSRRYYLYFTDEKDEAQGQHSPRSLNQSDQIRSVAQSCPTLCDPMNCSTPGLPVHHQVLEFTETHVHQVSDAIQPSHPLSSPSPPAPNPSQHQSLFQWVSKWWILIWIQVQVQHDCLTVGWSVCEKCLEYAIWMN